MKYITFLFYINFIWISNVHANYTAQSITKKDGLYSNHIRSLYLDSINALWVISDNGLQRYNGKTFSSIANANVKGSFKFNLVRNKTVVNNYRYFYSITLQGNMQPIQSANYLYTGYGLCIPSTIYSKLQKKYELTPLYDILQYIAQNLENTNFSIVNDSTHLLANNKYNLLLFNNSHLQLLDSNSNNYYFVLDNKLFSLHPNNVIHHIPLNKQATSKQVVKMPYGLSSRLQFLYTNNNHGVLVYKHQVVSMVYSNNKLVCQLVANNKQVEYTCAVSLDQNRLIFVGSQKHGLWQFTPNTINYIQHLKNHAAYSMDYDLYNNKLINNQYFNRLLLNMPWQWGNVNAILQLPDLRWLVAVKQQIFLLDKNHKPIKTWLLRKGVVKQFVIAKEKIFFNNTTLGSIDLKSLTCKEIDDLPMPNLHVDAICIGLNRSQLLVALGNLLYVYNTNLNRWQLKIAQLPFVVRHIYADKSKHVYFFSTVNSGIWLYTNNKLLTFPLDANKYLLQCHYVLKDGLGNYWMPSNNGLFYCTRNQVERFLTNTSNRLAYTYFDIKHGLLDNEFNGGFSNCGIAIKDTVYFASMKGVVAINSKSVFFTSKKFNTHVSVNDYYINGIQHKHLTNYITLPYNYVSFKINLYKNDLLNEVSSLHWRFANQIDSSWNDVSDEQIFLPRLPPGQYQIQIAASGLNQTVLFNLLELKVEQPWYLNNLFIGFYIVAFILILTTIYYATKKYLYYKNIKELEVMRNNLMAMLSHDLRTPLINFKHVHETLLYLINQNRIQDISLVVAELKQNASQLDIILEKVLKWFYHPGGGLQKNVSTFDPAQAISDIIVLYGYLTSQKNIKINISNQYNNSITCNKFYFDVLFRNILDNAVKYCLENTAIEINIKEEKDLFMIEILNETLIKHLKELEMKINTRPVNPNLTQAIKYQMGVSLMIWAADKLKSTFKLNTNNNYVKITIIIKS